MAALAQESGKYDDAEVLYKKTLSIRERLLGEWHPELALTLNDFAVSSIQLRTMLMSRR